MTKKDITISDLAIMVQKGFEKTATVEQLEKLENEFTIMQNEMKIIRKHQIMHTIYRDEFEKLETRVRELESMLDFKKR